MMPFFMKNLAFAGWKYALLGVAIVGFGAYMLFGRGGNVGATLTIIPGDFAEEVNVSGTVIAARDVDLGFAANGRIAGTYVRVGERVGAGTILAQTENGDLIAALSEAEANLASLKAGTRLEEVEIASVAVENAKKALIAAVQSAYTVSDDAVHNKADSFFTTVRTDPKLSFTVSNLLLKTKVEQEREAIEPALISWSALVSQLTAENAAASARESQNYLKQVVTFLSDANAALNQAVADQNTSADTLSSYASTLATGRTNVNSAATTLADDIAALDSALRTLALKQAGSTAENIRAQEAVVRAAAASLAKTRIVAPFSGVVTRMDAKVGEIVSPSSSLISMQSDGVFQIETFVPEVAIVRIATGNLATTTLDAYGSSLEFPSKVIAVDPAETVKDGVPTYKATLSFLTADPRIRSGMTANVRITTRTLPDAIVIPQGAVKNSQDGASVFVVTKGGATERPVTLGTSPALGQVEVLSGLSAGDVILLTPSP